MVEALSPTEPRMSAVERQGRTIYRWLLVSPLITLPCMILGLALAEMAQQEQQEQQERAARAARQSDARGVRGTEPSWSPDGARLAFVSERAGSESMRRGERWAWWAAFANVAFGGAAVIPASRFQHGPIASWKDHDRSTQFMGIALASALSGLILAGATLASGTGARSGATDRLHQEP